MAAEEEMVDDGEVLKSGKLFFSRCSPPYFKKVMEELKPILGKQQLIRIKDTPFGNWIDIPILPVSSLRIDYLLKRFQRHSCSFIVGDNIGIPFTSTEFSIILGLHHIGQQIDLDLKMESSFLARQFGGKVSNAERGLIYNKLILLAGSEVESDIDDFVRIFILFVFNCIIFATGNYITPSFIFPYLDDVNTIFKFAWGDAAFRFLYRELQNLGSKTYLDGCTVGLMAWLYERVPSLAVRRGLHIFPRLFRWGKSKIPLKAAHAESVFEGIDSTKVLSIYPLDEEEVLLDVKVLKAKEGTSAVRKLEKIVQEQNEEIKLLKRMCAQSEHGNRRRGARRKLVLDKEHVVLETEGVADIKGKTVVGETDLNLKEEFGEVNETEEELDINLENDVGLNFDDVVGVVVHGIVDEVEIEKSGALGGESANEKVGAVSGKVCCEEPEGGRGVNLLVQNDEKLEKEKSATVEDGFEKGSCDELDVCSDVSVLVRNIVDELAKENTAVVGDVSMNAAENESKSGNGSEEGISKPENITIFQSSIVEDVRTRDDRKKKRKISIFVTPPSSTPKRKGNKKAKCFEDVENEGKSPDKSDMDAYKDRFDFCGCEEATDKEIKLVTDYLATEELDVVIWEDDVVRLNGAVFCRFIFREPVDSEIINVHMRIMQKLSQENGFEIYCMDTIVQREVLDQLGKYSKKRRLKTDEYDRFLASLTSTTLNRLRELNGDLFARCRYIIFPLNNRWHWFLLVFKKSEGKFKLWNSLPDSFSLGTARVYASFLVGCVRHLSKFSIGSEDVRKEICRHQGDTLDCGVFLLMWVECLARDMEEMWSYQKAVKMDTYRARVAATILSDANGLLGNKSE